MRTVKVAAMGLFGPWWFRIPPVSAAETPVPVDFDKLVGQPADLAPRAYAWPADRKVQEKPEACFIPRRTERLDKVWRPLVATPGFERSVKESDSTMPAAPKGRLWRGSGTK